MPSQAAHWESIQTSVPKIPGSDTKEIKFRYNVLKKWKDALCSSKQSFRDLSIVPPFRIASPHTCLYPAQASRQGVQGISHSLALAVVPTCPNLPLKHISWLLTQVTSLLGLKILQTQQLWCSSSSASRSHFMPANQSSVSNEKHAITFLTRYLKYFCRPALPSLKYWNADTSRWDKNPTQH